MKRGVLEEKIHDQATVDGSIYPVACIYYVIERNIVRYHYQGACLVLGHISACF